MLHKARLQVALAAPGIGYAFVCISLTLSRVALRTCAGLTSRWPVVCKPHSLVALMGAAGHSLTLSLWVSLFITQLRVYALASGLVDAALQARAHSVRDEVLLRPARRHDGLDVVPGAPALARPFCFQRFRHAPAWHFAFISPA